MKAAAAMKAMKAMKVSKVATGKLSKSSVFRGTKERTSGGLKKSDLIKSKTGKVVSKKKVGGCQETLQRQRFGQMVPCSASCPQSFGLEGLCGGEEGNASLRQGKIIDEVRCSICSSGGKPIAEL